MMILSWAIFVARFYDDGVGREARCEIPGPLLQGPHLFDILYMVYRIGDKKKKKKGIDFDRK